MYSADVIQAFNKTTGIKRMEAKGKYCLKYPFEADKIDIDKRKDANISGDKNQYINAVKEWYKINIVDVPNEKWEIGHLDPTIGDSSEKILRSNHLSKEDIEIDSSFAKVSSKCGRLLKNLYQKIR
jgi:hypothetical protein